MKISIDELDSIVGYRSQAAVRIAELENILEVAEKKNAELMEENANLRAENEQLKETRTTLSIENAWLKNMLVLSAERIQEYMSHVKDLARWSFLRSFVEWVLPDRFRKEQLSVVNRVMALPDDKPEVINVQGNYNDVHDNHKVSIEGDEWE